MIFDAILAISNRRFNYKSRCIASTTNDVSLRAMVTAEKKSLNKTGLRQSFQNNCRAHEQGSVFAVKKRKIRNISIRIQSKPFGLSPVTVKSHFSGYVD